MAEPPHDKRACVLALVFGIVLGGGTLVLWALSSVLPQGLFVNAVTFFLLFVATLVTSAFARPGRAPAAGAAPPGEVLEDLASRLADVSPGRPGPRETSSVEGLFRGERVSARVSAEGSEALWRLVARVELSVPMSHAATIVRGPDGPCLAGFRPLPDRYQSAEGAAPLQVLLRLCDEVDLGDRGVEARARDALPGPTIVILVEELAKLAAFVRRTAQDDALLVRARAAVKCPFCHDEVDTKVDDVAACPRCATKHHAECWTENRGRCTVAGCEPPRAERVADL